MKLRAIKGQLTKRMNHARDQAHAATKIKGINYDSGTALWWTAKWDTYKRVLHLLKKLD